jgi:hypothetical protein
MLVSLLVCSAEIRSIDDLPVVQESFTLEAGIAQIAARLTQSVVGISQS